MTDHVVAALRKRREENAGQVHDAERRFTQLRAAPANLDAAIAILTLGHPDMLPPVAGSAGVPTSGGTSLSRLVRASLRDARKRLAAGEIAAAIIAAKGFPDTAHLAVTKMIGARLGTMTRRREIVKDGKTRNARWTISFMK